MILYSGRRRNIFLFIIAKKFIFFTNLFTANLMSHKCTKKTTHQSSLIYAEIQASENEAQNSIINITKSGDEKPDECEINNWWANRSECQRKEETFNRILSTNFLIRRILNTNGKNTKISNNIQTRAQANPFVGLICARKNSVYWIGCYFQRNLLVMKTMCTNWYAFNQQQHTASNGSSALFLSQSLGAYILHINHNKLWL